MSRREKTEFILQQVALCIEKGDWTQAGILSRKISTRYFNRKPKKTPEQLEKERKEREEKEKTRSADEPPPEVRALAAAREAARASRDFAEADRLRDELRAREWEVRDGPEGPELIPA